MGFSVAFNVLASVRRCADAHFDLGCVLLQQGRVSEAIAHYERALQLKPDYADAHLDLGTALGREGKIEEAMGHYEQALRIKPDFAEAHYGLGVALERVGRMQDASGHYEQAVRLKPSISFPAADLSSFSGYPPLGQ